MGRTEGQAKDGDGKGVEDEGACGWVGKWVGGWDKCGRGAIMGIQTDRDTCRHAGAESWPTHPPTQPTYCTNA